MLTKVEALKKTAEMWKWLSEHPQKTKTDYFTHEAIFPRPTCLCYCCQYAKEKYAQEHNLNVVPVHGMNREICEFCPISDWGGDKKDYNCAPCEEYGSPYQAWRHNVTAYLVTGESNAVKSKKTAALNVADLASKQLEQVKIKEA